MSPYDVAACDIPGQKFPAKRSKNLLGRSTIVLTEIADIKIQSNAIHFWPGVDGKMGFSQHYCPGGATFCRGTLKLVKSLCYWRKSSCPTSLAA